MPLLDLKDFKRMLQFVTNEGKEAIQKEYGQISSSSISTILRKIIEIEQQGAENFFGEKSFEVDDFCRQDEDGNGVISIIRLTDIQDKPKLFSTFMLSLLAEIYNTFPESGDMDKPKLILFIDEAHLIFNEATKALLDQIEAIIKLIRSKGVGIFFCTQSPGDVPDAVLGQLGLKVQHALRAFTAKDRKEIKKAAENFPDSPFYKTDEVLTQMGIGEALITALDRKGRPTPLAVTYLRAPMSRMDILSDIEINELVSESDLAAEYNIEIDRESAFEILEKKVNIAAKREEEVKKHQKSDAPSPQKDEPSFIETLSKNTMVRQIGRTVVNQLMRGLLGTLGVSTSSPRSPKRRKR
jgi:DNA helicase HerA-like ATPase